MKKIIISLIVLMMCFSMVSVSVAADAGQPGFFGSLFDLGAVVSYRLTRSGKDYSGLPDKVTFKQIFSPGFSLNLGWKNSPFTIGAGIQWAPELRKIKDKEGIITDETNSLRYFFRLSWDMPLIRLSKKKN